MVEGGGYTRRRRSLSSFSLVRRWRCDWVGLTSSSARQRANWGMRDITTTTFPSYARYSQSLWRAEYPRIEQYKKKKSVLPYFSGSFGERNTTTQSIKIGERVKRRKKKKRSNSINPTVMKSPVSIMYARFQTNAFTVIHGLTGPDL